MTLSYPMRELLRLTRVVALATTLTVVLLPVVALLDFGAELAREGR